MLAHRPLEIGDRHIAPPQLLFGHRITEAQQLLRRFGPFSTDARVWVEGRPDPVVETAEALDDLPRVTYHLTARELDRLHALLAEGGPGGTVLVPRRARARR